MSLPTFFSVTPLNPRAYTYDPANSTAPYAHAHSCIYGATVLPWGNLTLAYQNANDMVIMGHDAVPLENQDLWTPHPYQTCVLNIFFWGTNVSIENQYLLIFELHQISATPHAQIFVNSDLVDTVQVTGIEKHAILLDCPGSNIPVCVWIRLASLQCYSMMAFRGVDCHLL